MNKVISIFFFFFFISSAGWAQKDKKEIKAVFENYKAALIKEDGDEAVKYLDSHTIKYYQNIADKARGADSVEVDALPVMDKIMVLSVRHRASKEEVLAFNGITMVSFAIKNGMVGKSTVSDNSLGEITINGNVATAQLIKNKEKSSILFKFYKENNEWKFDLSSFFPLAGIGFKKLVKDSGKPENEYLLMLLEFASKKKPSPAIWKPVAEF